MLQDKFLSLSLDFFVNYFIENNYRTNILIGEPAQEIPGFLDAEQSGFFLTNWTCPSKRIYNYQKSSNFKLIEKKKL